MQVIDKRYTPPRLSELSYEEMENAAGGKVFTDTGIPLVPAPPPSLPPPPQDLGKKALYDWCLDTSHDLDLTP